MKGSMKVIGRSVLSLAATLAIGGGVTYALFTSNPVTVSQTTLSTGSSNLRICNSNQSTPVPGSNHWQDSVSASITFAGLTPGAAVVDIAPTTKLFLGNDNGSLATGLGDGQCDGYDVAAGTSTVSFKVVPTLENVVCGDDAETTLKLRDLLSMRFTAGTTASTYKTLAEWTTNTTASGSTFAPGDVKPLKLEAKLDSTYERQGVTCTFDVKLLGQS